MTILAARRVLPPLLITAATWSNTRMKLRGPDGVPPPESFSRLLRSVDKQKLGTALKGASETLKDLFFSNMSERAAKILREDMAAMGPVRVREVDESQMYMVQLAKDLAARGEIVIAEGSGENELIY